MEPIQHRYDFVLLFDVKDGNPNGDPDAGNSPRIDPETGHGLVTDVCLKRKIRNYVCLAKANPSNGGPEPGYDIYVKEKAVLNQQHEKAYVALGLKDEKGAKKSDNETQARKWMCQTFFDIRMFGAVMSTGDKGCGQVRGPVQFAFARSVDPIVALEQSITRMAVTNERDLEKERTMGRKEIVPYGMYAAHGFISPHLAAYTGFSDADLNLLWRALGRKDGDGGMFEHDRSAARGEMASQKLIAFEHESMLGNAPAHALFTRLRVTRKDSSKPARSYSDYDVSLDKSNLPPGVTVHELL
jgi:CRISPR-associated protein Csd2